MQKNFLQSLTPALPHWLKSSAVVGEGLKLGSSAGARLGLRRLLYASEAEIVLKILAALGRPSSAREVKDYQGECKSLFSPEQRLYFSSRELVLYPLVRILKPKTVVETGCAWGGSAAYLLAALQKNDSGTLISIDLPASDTIQHKEMGIREGEIGALIPAELRNRWKLVVGDARVWLPRVLVENEADIFIHDSLHTATHQAFEYQTARSLMKKDAVIASDDIRWNDSFPSFLRLHRLTGFAPLGDKNFGITVNAFVADEIQYGLFR
jgi:hypothetical protein